MLTLAQNPFVHRSLCLIRSVFYRSKKVNFITPDSPVMNNIHNSFLPSNRIANPFRSCIFDTVFQYLIPRQPSFDQNFLPIFLNHEVRGNWFSTDSNQTFRDNGYIGTTHSVLNNEFSSETFNLSRTFSKTSLYSDHSTLSYKGCFYKYTYIFQKIADFNLDTVLSKYVAQVHCWFIAVYT